MSPRFAAGDDNSPEINRSEVFPVESHGRLKRMREAPELTPLFEAAWEGKITPEEAERQAAEMGAGPLAKDPDQRNFEVFLESQWTLCMALAWLLWRDEVRVLHEFPSFAQQRLVWNPRIFVPGDPGSARGGWYLDQPPRPSVAGLSSRRDTASSIHAPATEAEVAAAMGNLWGVVADGQVAARAFDNSRGCVRTMEPGEWATLGYTPSTANGDRLYVKSNHSHPGFDAVEFRAADLLTTWPAGKEVGMLSEPTAVAKSGRRTSAQWMVVERALEVPEIKSAVLTEKGKVRRILEWVDHEILNGHDLVRPSVTTIQRVLRSRARPHSQGRH